MRNILAILFIVFSFCKNSFANDGTSCDKPILIFPSDDCINFNGKQFLGNKQCPTADCDSYLNMNGTSGSFNPGCSIDDEKNQPVLWMKVRATSESISINNGKAYIGSGAANANTKDYVVFSGACGNLQQIYCHTLTANASATITGLTVGKDYLIMASPSVTNESATALSVCITSTVPYKAQGDICEEAEILEINKTYSFNNVGATPDGPQEKVSAENNTWYRWTAPSDWTNGQSAFVKIYNLGCNSSEGLQATLWTTDNDCPKASDESSPISKVVGSTEEYFYQWTPRANRTYLISIDGYAGTACQYNLHIGSQPALPDNLISLDAISQGQSVLLNWLTIEENNNSYFTIEKSKDGRKFIPLLNVEGAGKSTTERSYSTRDDYPFADVNYYRLKQTDFEGNYSYSKTVAVDVKSEGRLFHAWSHPSAENIGIAYFSDMNEAAVLRIFDNSGRQMYNMSLQLAQGRNDYRINARLLSQGNYTVKLETGSSSLSSRILLEEE